MNEKIFINIASFRDPTLGVTIESALVNARNPENLVFGIGAQYYDGEMPSINVDPSQLKIISYHPDTRPGLVKIRYEISKMLTDEKYFLMIDSHVLFKKDWDVNAKKYLIRFSKLSGHDRVLFGGKAIDPLKTSTSNLEFQIFKNDTMDKDNKGIVKNEIILIQENIARPIDSDFTLNYYVSCSNFFTYSKYIEDVGLDSKSEFLYEEPYLSWKTYVSGWDNYVLHKPIIYQNHEAYFNIVWQGNYDNRTYYRKELEASDFDKADIASAMIFNKSKNFSVKNERRSPESFWELIGKKEMFEDLKNSKEFKEILSSFNLFNLD